LFKYKRIIKICYPLNAIALLHKDNHTMIARS
jgi:hypothetical protein